MSYSLHPRDGDSDNVPSTPDGGVGGGAPDGDNNNQNKTASRHTSKKRKYSTQTANDNVSNNKLHRGVGNNDKSCTNNRSTASESSANEDVVVWSTLWSLANINNISLLKRLALAAKVIGEDYTPPDEREYNNQDRILRDIIAPLVTKLVDHYELLPNGLQKLKGHVANNGYNLDMDMDSDDEEEEELVCIGTTTSDSNIYNINNEFNNLCSAGGDEHNYQTLLIVGGVTIQNNKMTLDKCHPILPPHLYLMTIRRRIIISVLY